MNEGAPDARTLARLAMPMTENDFLSLCEERALAGKCGNPLCYEAHKYVAAVEKAQIDWSSLELVKTSIDQHWCSTLCHIKCAQFARSLGNALDRLEVLRKLRNRTGTHVNHRISLVVARFIFNNVIV
jgi:hypothetical protein